MKRQVEYVIAGTNQKHQDANHATIFSEILQSKRPEQEKSKKRLEDEAQVIISARVETTAWTMSVIQFYFLHNTKVLKILRK